MTDLDLLHYLENNFLTDQRKQRFLEVLGKRTRFLTVAMEDVYQLHNTSAVLRSCDAFGIQDLHVVEDRFGKRLDKNIAMGSEQWVDVHRYQNTEDCLKHLKNLGYRLVATTPHETNHQMNDFEVSEKTALFFGTEKEGLSEAVIAQADDYLTIPMVGFAESLNISVSAAIIIQRLAEQLRNSELPWQLEDSFILEKRLDWTKKSIKNVEGIIERYLSR